MISEITNQERLLCSIPKVSSTEKQKSNDKNGINNDQDQGFVREQIQGYFLEVSISSGTSDSTQSGQFVVLYDDTLKESTILSYRVGYVEDMRFGVT